MSKVVHDRICWKNENVKKKKKKKRNIY